MLEKLGKRALIAPIGIGIVLCCILSLAVSPMLRADPNHLPFAIVNLDKGVVSITGDTNVGQTMTDNLISGETSLNDDDDDDETDDSVADSVTWTQLSSEEELQEAFDNNEYYGAIVIPDNFTSQQIGKKVGLNDAPELTVYLNKAKSPQMVNSMQITLATAMLKMGVAADIEIVNDAEIGGGTMADTMAVQMLVLPLFILTMVGSIFTALVFWKKDATGLRKKNPAIAAVVLLVFLVVLSAVMAGLALFVDTVAGSLTLPVGMIYPFIWFGCFCCMLCCVALCSLKFPLGILVTLCIFAFGLGTAMMPADMLPTFWTNWVCPWAPQAHFGNGLRTIIYMGQMPGMNDISPFIGFGVVGVIALIAAALLSKRTDTDKKYTEANS